MYIGIVIWLKSGILWFRVRIVPLQERKIKELPIGLHNVAHWWMGQNIVMHCMKDHTLHLRMARETRVSRVYSFIRIYE